MADRAIVSDPEIMNGTPCFAGTRVPFQNLIGYLAGGQPLGEFLHQFPTVSREQAIQALEEARESLFDTMMAPRASIKYWYCSYEINSDEPREEFYEVGDHGYVTRQVYVFPHAVVTSRQDFDPLVGGTLCDQPFCLWELTGLVEISRAQFEAAWHRPDPRAKA